MMHPGIKDPVLSLDSPIKIDQKTQILSKKMILNRFLHSMVSQ